MVDLLAIGSSGLTAYRKLLETVGGNIVNADSDGYVRRDVTLTGAGVGAMTPMQATEASGSGVFVDTVRRASDAFLFGQTLQSNAAGKQSETEADALAQLEKTVFASSANLASGVQDFYGAFAKLATSPASTTLRLTLIQSGRAVAEAFTGAARAIAASVDASDGALDAATRETNALGVQLAQVNAAIARSAAGGQKPNDLLDQRDKLLTQLSSLARVATRENANGAVDVYLGDSASGQPFIDGSGARQIGATHTGDDVAIVYDPNTAPVQANPSIGGVIGGLLAFRSQAKALMEQIDRLAVAVASSANKLHEQGVDLNGETGGGLFSTDTLAATAAPLNRGAASLTVDVTNAVALEGAAYTARFDEARNVWTISSSNGAIVAGANHVTIDGLAFDFRGAARDGDAFTIAPLKDAAASLRFLPKDGAEIATGLPVHVDPAASNKGAGQVTIVDARVAAPAAPLPSAADLLNGSGASGVGFLRDGAACRIPAGAASANIASIGDLSHVTFDVSASDVARLSNAGAAGGLTLALQSANGAGSLSLDLAPRGDALADLAVAIDEAAARAGLGRAIHASVENGRLTIAALEGASFVSGALQGFDGAGAPQSIDSVATPAAPAAALRVFTREGRQVAGPPLSPDEARAAITEANGFLRDAVYAPPPATPYRGLALADIASIAATSNVTATTATIDIHVSPAASGVYALDVAGLPPLRVAADAVPATDDAAAAALADRLDSLATRRQWLGAAIDLSTSPADLSFDVVVDGAATRVTFARNRDASGALLASGSFDVPKDSGFSLSLAPDGARGARILLSLAPKLSTATHAVSVQADAATRSALGFAGPLTAALGAAGALEPSLLAAHRPRLHVQGAAIGDVELSIDAPSGRLGAVSWRIVDGKLQIASTDPTLRIATSDAIDLAAARALGFDGAEGSGALLAAHNALAASMLASHPAQVDLADGSTLAIATPNGAAGGVSWSVVNGRMTISGAPPLDFKTTTSAARDAAAALGFFGTNLDLTRESGRLVLTSKAADAAGPLADASASSSGAGRLFRLDDAAPEDLIVMLATTQADGARRLAGTVGAGSGGAKTPDFQVRIASPDTLEIVDEKTGQTLATRNWTRDAPTTYLGVSFNVSGAARVGDLFHIAQDSNRAGDNRNALAIAKLATAAIFGPGHGSFQDVYAAVSGNFGSIVETAQQNAVAARQTASDLKSAYEAKTGVNLDAEAADLIRYQQAYQAAAQVVSSARTIFETILKSF